jgi:hypothetical protein
MTQTEIFFMTEPGIATYPVPEAKDDIRFRQYAVHIDRRDYLLQPINEVPAVDAKGTPTLYAQDVDGLHLWPVPDAAYKVVLI